MVRGGGLPEHESDVDARASGEGGAGEPRSVADVDLAVGRGCR